MSMSFAARLDARLRLGAEWLPAVALVAATVVIGPTLGSLARPAFILSCGVVGWYAWRRSPEAHLQAALVLFAFAPFARRHVDLAAGYDATGFMLVGPLLAILAPAIELRRIVERRLPVHMTPLIIVGGCVVYATGLSLFQGDYINAASGALKWFAPLLYGAVLMCRADCERVVQAAASAFLVILPVIGVYGIYQYVDPPAWDRFWMQYAPIMSAGQPVPYGVRTFSTMNGPASFATFTAAGLLLIGFLRPGWRSLLFGGPAALALLLSLYRTAWLSLAVCVLFCFLFAATRRRAAVILGGIFCAVLVAVTASPFAEVVGERLSSLGQGSQDGSLQERLEQYLRLWSQPDSALFGIGFTTTDVGTAGAMAVDGMIIACWLAMGIVVGLVCLAGLIWAAVAAVDAATRGATRESIVAGALTCGGLAQLPFANIASGELGFLFWTFAVLAVCTRRGTALARPW